MAAPADPEAVGSAFITYYYQLFESNRPALVGLGSEFSDLFQRNTDQHYPQQPLCCCCSIAQGNLYQDASMLTFEGQKFMGTQAILGKMSSLAFGACKIHLSSKDFQPSVSGGIMVFVTGNIQVVHGHLHCEECFLVFDFMLIALSPALAPAARE
jgi:hypothetical protein